MVNASTTTNMNPEEEEGGRYTILDRDFEPLHIDVQTEEIKINWDEYDKLKNFSDLVTTFRYKENSSSSGSTDSLLDEANDFLGVAKTKLVTEDDWEGIAERKKIRRTTKLAKKESNASNVSVNSNSTLPFVPHKIENLNPGDNVRFIGKSKKITQGQVKELDLTEEVVQVELDPSEDETQKCVPIPFEKIIMAWR